MGVKKQPGKSFEFHPDKADKLTIGIVVSEWNSDVTSSLLEGCMKTLEKYGIRPDNIHCRWVPGSFELPLGAQWLIEHNNTDAVICLGCVIKGETPHFHYISENISIQIGNLGLKYGRPVIFGVLTTENESQATERAGGKAGNKGEEAALAALKMLQLKSDIKSSSAKNIGYFG